ncbi:MAG: leucine-rich repeat domain-containing protein [Ruminococcus sp.]|nr:leucine-rich repeat domain-containing protein [Ruminococcus sp.]
MPDYDFLDGYGFVNNMSPFANDPYIWDRDTYDGIVKNVVISEGITRVGNGFFCLKSLKTVRLPDPLKSIGNGAFYACNNLESIRMPASVTSIGTLAFAYCTSLETVNIPKSITSMGTRVFEGTRWLGSKAVDNELVIEKQNTSLRQTGRRLRCSRRGNVYNRLGHWRDSRLHIKAHLDNYPQICQRHQQERFQGYVQSCLHKCCFGQSGIYKR